LGVGNSGGRDWLERIRKQHKIKDMASKYQSEVEAFG
jgi:hypothetical protein